MNNNKIFVVMSIDSQMLSEQLESLIAIIGGDKESILWGLVNMIEEIQDIPPTKRLEDSDA